MLCAPVRERPCGPAEHLADRVGAKPDRVGPHELEALDDGSGQRLGRAVWEAGADRLRQAARLAHLDCLSHCVRDHLDLLGDRERLLPCERVTHVFVVVGLGAASWRRDRNARSAARVRDASGPSPGSDRCSPHMRTAARHAGRRLAVRRRSRCPSVRARFRGSAGTAARPRRMRPSGCLCHRDRQARARRAPAVLLRVGGRAPARGSRPPARRARCRCSQASSDILEIDHCR